MTPRAGALLCVLLASCVDEYRLAGSGSTLQATGGRAVDFSARSVGGSTFRLSDYLGRDVILLNFWATYCGPCLAELPHLRELYQANKRRRFIVVGIAMDGPESISDVPSFVSRNGLTFPVVLDEDSHIASLYNPRKSAPFTVIIGRDGRVARVHEGYNPGDEDQIAADVAALLGPMSPSMSTSFAN